MAERRVVVKVAAERYQVAGKQEKGRILDEVMGATGYNRSYLRWLLRSHGKEVRVGDRVVVVGDVRARGQRRGVARYGCEVMRVLVTIWKLADYPSGKRLAPALAVWIPQLERYGELDVPPAVREQLLRISPATIDRRLAGRKQALSLKSRARTKPGTLLRSQVPIRTFADWDDAQPGFFELDLVGHDGGSSRGEYAFTLDATDVSSGWVSLRAMRNRAQVFVHAALEAMRHDLPFPLRGIDADNGGEFINHNLVRWCREHRLTFTRSRPNRKNDNCFVEERNWSVVRRYAGYARLEGDATVALLNRLWADVEAFVNFFQPSLRLREKVRHGARITRCYHPAQTPCQRLLASAALTDPEKTALAARFTSLNPAALARRIRATQHLLDRHVNRAVETAELAALAPPFPQPLRLSPTDWPHRENHDTHQHQPTSALRVDSQ